MQGIESLAGPASETAAERKKLPEYAAKGQWVKLPIKDANGDSMWLDMTYIIPMSDLNELSGIGGLGGQPGFASLPMLDAFQDLARNQSRFTGGPIYQPGATKAEKQKAVVTYVTDFLAPPIISKNLRNIAAAWKKVPTWDGREQSLTSAVAAAFAGLKTRSFDLDREYVSRIQDVQKKISETQSHLRSVLKDPRYSDKAKEQIWQDSLEQIEQYVDALQTLTE